MTRRTVAERIVAFLRKEPDAVASGYIATQIKAKVPSVRRELADLERAGLVSSVPGKGCRIYSAVMKARKRR